MFFACSSLSFVEPGGNLVSVRGACVRHKITSRNETCELCFFFFREVMHNGALHLVTVDAEALCACEPTKREKQQPWCTRADQQYVTKPTRLSSTTNMAYKQGQNFFGPGSCVSFPFVRVSQHDDT